MQIVVVKLAMAAITAASAVVAQQIVDESEIGYKIARKSRDIKQRISRKSNKI